MHKELYGLWGGECPLCPPHRYAADFNRLFPTINKRTNHDKNGFPKPVSYMTCTSIKWSVRSKASENLFKLR